MKQRLAVPLFCAAALARAGPRRGLALIPENLGQYPLFLSGKFHTQRAGRVHKSESMDEQWPAM